MFGRVLNSTLASGSGDEVAPCKLRGLANPLMGVCSSLFLDLMLPAVEQRRAGRPQRQQRRGPTRQDLRDQGQREQQDWHDEDREQRDPAEYVRGPQRQVEQYWWERDDDDGYWDTEPQYTEDRYNGYREQERARHYRQSRGYWNVTFPKGTVQRKKK